MSTKEIKHKLFLPGQFPLLANNCDRESSVRMMRLEFELREYSSVKRMLYALRLIVATGEYLGNGKIKLIAKVG